MLTVGLSAVILLGGCAAPATSVDPDGTHEAPMAAFSELVVAAPLEVALTAADEYRVAVTGDDDETDRVRISVDDEILSLHVEGNLSARPAVTVSLPAGALVDLDISEAAVVSTLDALESADLEVVASGGSSARLETDGLQTLAVNALDGSTVTMTGTGQVGSLDAMASDSSTLHLFDLPAADVTAHAREASTIEVTATRRLDASAAGVSTLTYRGSPADVTDNATDMSTITSD